MTPEQRRHVLFAPLRTWAALLALLLLTIAYAYWPALPAKAEAGFVIAAAKAALIGLLFMQLRTATGIVRIAATAGITWASILYLFAFADYLTRN